MRRKRKWALTVWLCVAVLGLLVVWGVKGVMAQQAAPPIKVAIICAQSGAAAYTGRAATEGAIVGLKEINTKGGILGGRKFTWQVLDDKGIPEEGVTALNRAIVDGCTALLGSVNSGVALAVNEVLRVKGMPTIHLAAMDPKCTNAEWGIFGRNLSTEVLYTAYAKYVAIPYYKPKSIYILAEDTAFGRAVTAPFKAACVGEGIEIKGEDKFALEETDFGPIIIRALAKKPDNIYFIGMDVMHKVKVLREAQARGLPSKMFIMSSLDPDVPQLIGGAYVEGARGWTAWTTDVPTAVNKRFIDLFKTEFKKEPNEKYQPYGYESAWSMALAMEKAGTDRDVGKWKKAMLEIKFEGPCGTIEWEAATGRPRPVFWEVESRKGRVELIRMIKP